MIETKTYPGKLALQQRVLPGYRAPFLGELGARCIRGLALFAGQPRSNEGIHTAEGVRGAKLTMSENVHRFGGPLYLCLQPGLLAWLKMQDADALIVEANPRYLHTPEAVAWMRERQRPVLGWGLGAPRTGAFGWMREVARRKLLNSLDGIIAYSQRGALEYRGLGMPADRVFVAYNAAAPRPLRLPERPARYEDRPQVIFVGRLQVRKRLDLLFKACAELPGQLQPEIVIVGEGPAREVFEEIAGDTYAHVRFVGAKHGEALEALLDRADLFVLPGTGGLAIQQAMSHGLPVVVAEGDGTQDDLVRPSNGWLVPPGDADALRKTLHEALIDIQRLRQKGQASFEITRDEINLQAMADVFVEALKTVERLGPRTVE